jgi:hypothetical protein
VGEGKIRGDPLAPAINSDRSALIPSIRRKIRKRLPDWYRQIRAYRKAHGVYPRVVNPVTFNEKILHRNLFDHRPLLKQMADKAAVRGYVESLLGPEILPKLYHLTAVPDTIPFDDLPDRFAVKATHGSGWVRLVTDKSRLDRAMLTRTCFDWLRRNYAEETLEVVYRDIEPRIIVEEFIDDGSGAAPNDYKLFVFDGTVEVIQVDTDRFTDHRRALYTPGWKRLDVTLAYPTIEADVPAPIHLTEMIAAAETLGRGWDFVRADFYDTARRIYFGELTMTPGGGHDRFHPIEFDCYLGGLWNISPGNRMRSER